jgi:hypothetical protein
MTEQKQLKVKPIMQINVAETGQVIIQGESTYMENEIQFIGLIGKVMNAMWENFTRRSEKKIQVIKPKIDLKI